MVTTWAITIRVQVPVARVVVTLHLRGYLTPMWLRSFSQFLSSGYKVLSPKVLPSPFYRFLFSFFRIRVLFYFIVSSLIVRRSLRLFLSQRDETEIVSLRKTSVFEKICKDIIKIINRS